MVDPDEELSDYREVLSCIRKRLERYGLTEALERLESLDDAILQAILDKVAPPIGTLIN